MTFSIILFISSWLSFFIFADKKKFITLAPTCLLAMYLACTSDMMTNVYPLWEYPASDKLHQFFRHLLHDTGVYPIVTYLFLQTLPRRKARLTVIRHIFYWSILAFIIEWIATRTGSMKYHLWWNRGCSFAADWILFFLFYEHHKWREKHN